jgi:N6-L-threonylcarbamoyladenine synthase
LLRISIFEFRILTRRSLSPQTTSLPVPLLAFETSCDETSAAIIHNGRILSNVVSSQIQMHAEYGGVVPELAAREHLRNLLPVTRAALAEAHIDATQIDAVAATQGPGLPSALMVGFKGGQAMAFALRACFVGVHHHEAHLYSPWIVGNAPSAEFGFERSRGRGENQNPKAGRHEANKLPEDSLSPFDGERARVRGSIRWQAQFSQFEPSVSLIVSGGHTMLVHVESLLKHRVLGSTFDDAAGECFDKAGKLLGLPYPAGPAIDRLAEAGNPRAFDFPRPMINEPHDDFSFSGLKTSIRYFLRDHPSLLDDRKTVSDLCASIQAAIVDVLVAKTIRAAKRLRVGCITASGGVTCNRALREQLADACAREQIHLRLADKILCTDNAAMIGILAEQKLAAGIESDNCDQEIRPNWQLV